MLKIASAVFVGVVGFLGYSCVPPDVAHSVQLLVARQWEIQTDHIRQLIRPGK